MTMSMIGALVRLKTERMSSGHKPEEDKRFNVIAIVRSGVVIEDVATGATKVVDDDKIVVVRHAHKR